MSSPGPYRYISFDIECDGQIIFGNSMRSVGMVLFDERGTELDSIEVHLQPHPGAAVDRDTYENFFMKQCPAAWEHLLKDALPPKEAIDTLAAWINKHCPRDPSWRPDSKRSNYALIASPSGWDLSWLEAYWSWYRNGDHLNWFQCIDIRSFAMGKLNLPTYADTALGGPVVSKYKPTQGQFKHHAVDDARCQGQMFFNLRDGRLVAQ